MQITNREAEVALADDLLTELVTTLKTPIQCILEFVGITGSGKSILLRKIREVTREYAVRTVFVDFAGLQYKKANDLDAKCLLGQTLLDQLQLDVPSVGIIQSLLARSSEPDRQDADSSIEQLYHALLDALAASGNAVPHIFIFDSLDQLPESLLNWLITALVTPLVAKRAQIIFSFVVSSRFLIEWKDYDIKNALTVAELRPFSAEETTRQLRDTIGDDPARHIHKITNGLPLLNAYTASRFKEISQEKDFVLDEAKYGVMEARLIRDLVATVVEVQIMKGVPGTLIEIFRLIAISSFFDLDLLEVILEDHFPGVPRNPPSRMRIQAEMCTPKYNLARWESGRKAVVINTVVRKTLSLDMRLNDPGRYGAVSKSIASCMEERIHQGFNVSSALCELLVQEANQLSLQPSCSIAEIVSKLSNTLTSYLSKCYTGKLGLEKAMELRHELDQSDDLRVRLGPDHQSLLLEVERFIENLSAEQERMMQKAILEIVRQEPREDSDFYYVSLSLPDRSGRFADTFPVPKQIRIGIMSKLESSVDHPVLCEVGAQLFRSFMPPEVQRRLFSTDVPLAIITDDAELPWELMYDGNRFLCREECVSRVLSGPDNLQETQLSRRRSSRILLIANPTSDDSLSETEKEVEQIAALVQRLGLNPEFLIGPDASVYKVSTAFSSGQYGIIHYAGHAQYDPGQRQSPSLLLSDGPYPAASILNALAGTPFVFLNACFSAKTERVSVRTWRWAIQTLGIASAFVQKGAVGCVGSLWRVFDKAASKFSVDFYSSLATRVTVAAAFRDARRKCVETDTAWASYVMYADPMQRIGDRVITSSREQPS